MIHIKFYLSCLFLSLLFFNVHSQAVFAPVKNAKWTYIASSFTFNSGSGEQTNDHQVIKAFYSRDTLFKNKVYKLIDLNFEVLGTKITPVLKDGAVIRTDTIHYYQTPYDKFLIRQSADSLWAISSSDTIERLYFVYSLVPDTLDLANRTYHPRKVFIDSISTVQVNGKKFNAWKGRSYTITGGGDVLVPAYYKFTFLDKIGPIDDLLQFIAFRGQLAPYDTIYPYGLVCYEDPEVGLLRFKNLDCNLVLKVATKEILISNSIKCYLDWPSQSLVIKSEEINLDDLDLTLLNLNGQKILKTSLNGLINYVSLGRYMTSGIYFACFYNKATGFLTTKKVFITN